MVDVGMAEDDRPQTFWVEGKIAVDGIKLVAVALEDAAVQQQ